MSVISLNLFDEVLFDVLADQRQVRIWPLRGTYMDLFLHRKIPMSISDEKSVFSALSAFRFQQST
jgi:hypothetical protein